MIRKGLEKFLNVFFLLFVSNRGEKTVKNT